MGEIAGIYSVIARARRRMRLQESLEAATLCSILAIAAAATVLYLHRASHIGATTATFGLLASVTIVVVGALGGWLRRPDNSLVANRIDAASGLADRLSTACDFDAKLQSGKTSDPETAALMRAAIADAVRALPRADVTAATPYRAPREGKAAIAFAIVGGVVALLAFPPANGPGAAVLATGTTSPDSATGPSTNDPPVVIEQDDLLYSRDLLEELRKTARDTDDDHLRDFVKKVDDLIARAERGELTKEQLLEQLAKAERDYMQGSDDDIQEAVDDLRQTGRELQKNQLTRELGMALEHGDLSKAQQEFDKLADKLESGELSDKQEAQVAKSLQKAADKFQKAADKRDQQATEQITKQREEVRRLQRQVAQEQNPETKRRLTRHLDKKQRDLKRLERKQEQQQQSASKRRLKQLHRNMKKASEQMQDRSGDQQQRKERKRQASQRMRDAGQQTGGVDKDRRRVNNQRKVATQVTDLREALRRAKRKGRGQGSQFGKNNRRDDLRQRARGGKGQRGAWKPGGGRESRLGKSGSGQGTQPGGKNWGTEDGGDPLGAPTAKQHDTTDQALTGVHGKGPSTRQTILSAAQKGFASRAYQEVYANYKAIVEEVMRSEKVPSGYRYYIGKYFQEIKPRSTK